MIVSKKIKKFVVQDYTDNEQVKKYLERYPQYRLEGSSFSLNGDGTWTNTVRFNKFVNDISE